MTLEHSLKVLDQIQKIYYPRPYPKIRSDDMYYIATNKYYATHEIMIALQKNPRKNPIDVIEEFRKKVDDFQCRAKEMTTQFMFGCYYDVATHVLDVFISEMEKKRWKG